MQKFAEIIKENNFVFNLINFLKDNRNTRNKKEPENLYVYKVVCEKIMNDFNISNPEEIYYLLRNNKEMNYLNKSKIEKVKSLLEDTVDE